MNFTDIPSRIGPLAEELLENSYARENLGEGGEKLRDAYGRARKRRVSLATDRKLHRQLKAAIAALDEGALALARGRRKPKQTGRKLALALLIVAGAGAAVAIAMNAELRKSLLDAAKVLGEEIREAPSDENGPVEGEGRR